MPGHPLPLHLVLLFLNFAFLVTVTAVGLGRGLWGCHCAILFAFLLFKLLVQLIAARWVALTSALLIDTGEEGLEHPSSSTQHCCNGGCWHGNLPREQRKPSKKSSGEDVFPERPSHARSRLHGADAAVGTQPHLVSDAFFLSVRCHINIDSYQERGSRYDLEIHFFKVSKL